MYFTRNLNKVILIIISSAGVSPEMNQECLDYKTQSGIKSICRTVERPFPSAFL